MFFSQRYILDSWMRIASAIGKEEMQMLLQSTPWCLWKLDWRLLQKVSDICSTFCSTYSGHLLINFSLLSPFICPSNFLMHKGTYTHTHAHNIHASLSLFFCSQYSFPFYHAITIIFSPPQFFVVVFVVVVIVAVVVTVVDAAENRKGNTSA